MIEVDERFDVPASPDVVWRLLADPYAVVGCVPGAAIVGQAEDGSLDTTLTVKFGPLSVGFQARAELQLDPSQHRGTLSARGKDKQGGARFQASATFSVAAAAPGDGPASAPRAASTASDAAPMDSSDSDARIAVSGTSTSGDPSESDPSGTTAATSVVVVRGEVDISGRLASMIEAGAGVIVKRMSSEFADCLRARCAAAAASETQSG